MRIFVRGRRAGKTHAAVEWVRGGVEISEYPFWSRIIVTSSEREAARLREDYDLDYRQVFSARDWTTRRRGTGMSTDVVADNADAVLQDLLGPLHGVTMTGVLW